MKSRECIALPPSPPGPKGHFLIGHLLEYRRDPLGFLTRCAREYGDIVNLRVVDYHFYLVSHPDYIEDILAAHSTNFIKDKFLRMRPTRRLFGNGLLSSEGDFWRRQRILAQPSFHRERIAFYGEVMVSYTTRLLDQWQEGEIYDVHREIMQLSMQIVAKTLFNVDIRIAAKNIGAALEEMVQQFTFDANVLELLSAFLSTPLRSRFEKAARRLDDIIYSIIKERRESGLDTGDLLSMLLQARDGDGARMSDRQLRDEAMTIFLAGYETTANAITWTWYLLAKHPEVETKLVEELATVLGDRTPTAEDLPHLTYTEMVLKEAMRLYPPAWSSGREVLRDCEIGGYHAPAGLQIRVAPWIVHRDPRYFEQPEEFRPERWTSNFTKHLPRYAYFPFGGGPRQCIGRTFAMMEAILVISTMAQRFRFQLAADQPVEPLPTITLRPKEGLNMVIYKQMKPSESLLLYQH